MYRKNHQVNKQHLSENYGQIEPKPEKFEDVMDYGQKRRQHLQQCGCCPSFYAASYQKHTNLNLAEKKPKKYRWNNNATNVYFLKLEVTANRFSSYREPLAIFNVIFYQLDIGNFYSEILKCDIPGKLKKCLT